MPEAHQSRRIENLKLSFHLFPGAKKLMSRTLILFTAVSLAAGLLAVNLVSPARAQKSTVSPLAYRERKLPNGLRLISLQDNSTPTVAIQVWYKVGSKDDPEGRSGFAHLFEHLMFKETKNMKSEMLDRLTEDIGGENNAFTADDMTVYYEVVPSNYLETLLWAEADRLASLSVDDPNFKSERDVVKEEYRERVLAPPYGKLGILIEQKSYTVHPYRRPGIGNIDELNAATIDDVRKFHGSYYRPDNVTMVIVGDFDQKQLDAWVDRYFARIPKPAMALPRVEVKEPPRTSERRYVEYNTNVPLPAIAVTYLLPPAADADAPALQVAETILSEGESSRLYNALVYEQQLAAFAGANADLREDTGLFVVQATMASGKRPEDGERALYAEIKRMQNTVVLPAELSKAINQLVTGELRERETNNGKALALGRAAVVLGDASRANSSIEQLRAVTASDVQRVMRKYFSDTNRVVIHYLPESMRAGGK